MARVPKTPKFKEFDEFPNTFVFKEDSARVEYFSNDKPLTLEIGCGKAEPSLAFARKYPAKNFIGIDLKADRLWRPAKTALSEGLDNVVFIKTHVRFLSEAFAPNSIDSIWLTFSDPYPKPRQEKHRLTHPKYLEIYKSLLKPGGSIYFKTDNRELFDWSLAQFAHDDVFVIKDLTYDLHKGLVENIDALVITYYEQRFIDEGTKINYLELSV